MDSKDLTDRIRAAGFYPTIAFDVEGGDFSWFVHIDNSKRNSPKTWEGPTLEAPLQAAVEYAEKHDAYITSAPRCHH